MRKQREKFTKNFKMQKLWNKLKSIRNWNKLIMNHFVSEEISLEYLSINLMNQFLHLNHRQLKFLTHLFAKLICRRIVLTSKTIIKLTCWKVSKFHHEGVNWFFQLRKNVSKYLELFLIMVVPNLLVESETVLGYNV